MTNLFYKLSKLMTRLLLNPFPIVSLSAVEHSTSCIQAEVDLTGGSREAVDQGRTGQLLFQRALRAYPSVGLKENHKKRKTDQAAGTILGGYLEGLSGFLMAPPFKVLILMNVTLRVCILGVATRELLEVLAGSWVYVIMFRRPGMSIMQQIFHEGSDYRSPGRRM